MILSIIYLVLLYVPVIAMFWFARLIKKEREQLEKTYKQTNPQPDEVLMQLNEQIDRAKALADGKRAQLIQDGWNETIAEQISAALMMAAVVRQ